MGDDEKDGNLTSLQQSPAPDSDAHIIPQEHISQDNGDGKEPEDKCPITYVPPEGGGFNSTTAIFSPCGNTSSVVPDFLICLKNNNNNNKTNK